jgi:hypothetical protein
MLDDIIHVKNGMTGTWTKDNMTNVASTDFETVANANIFVLLLNRDSFAFFVREYCLRPQMALLTVPGGEARTMVGPQPTRASCTRRTLRRVNTTRSDSATAGYYQLVLIDSVLYGELIKTENQQEKKFRRNVPL